MKKIIITSGIIFSVVLIFFKGESIFMKFKYSFNYLNFLITEPKNRILKNPQTKKINIDRIIAHAGGEVEGFIYTNSLEALNSNYSHGIRYFELDLKETIDGVYVGVHDWDEWKFKTGYKGIIPPTHEEFMKTKIHKKFTPLDINKINLWFNKHKNALLVTDKVNKPKEFLASLEISKDRVIMELFTWESIIQAKNIGLNVMASWEVFSGMNDSEIFNSIKNYGINYLAVPNNLIYTKSDLLKKIMPLAKVYSWGSYEKIPNNFGNKTESFVLCNEYNFIYGVYMDICVNSNKIICYE